MSGVVKMGGGARREAALANRAPFPSSCGVPSVMPSRRGPLARAFLTCLALAACEPPTTTGPTGVMTDYVTAVTARNGEVVGTLRVGALPAGTAGTAAAVAGVSGAVNGGSAQVRLRRTEGFQRVLVGVQGVDAFYDLTLPTGTSLEDLVVGIAPRLEGGSLQMRYAVAGPEGFGPFATQTMRVIKVGTGDVQVSIAWSGASDIDLHIFDPAGEEIFYDNKQSASGGMLDLDSNAACAIDGRNAENVVWPASGAPRGQYRVVVDYYDDCGVAQTDWVVTLQVAGVEARTLSGSFTGIGATTPMLEVATFTY
jgi:hypothetical protein